MWPVQQMEHKQNKCAINKNERLFLIHDGGLIDDHIFMIAYMNEMSNDRHGGAAVFALARLFI